MSKRKLEEQDELSQASQHELTRFAFTSPLMDLCLGETILMATVLFSLTTIALQLELYTQRLYSTSSGQASH